MSVIQQSKKIFETSSAITQFVDIFNVDIARIQIDGEGITGLQVKILGRLNPEQGYHEILIKDDSTGEPVDIITDTGIYSCDVSGYIDLEIAVGSISGGMAQFYLATVCITPEGEMSDIPPATATSLGGIKVGDNLSITTDGVLSATGGGTGTSNYNDLNNLPTLNGVEIKGNKTAADYNIGGEDKTYVYSQTIPASEWNIKHNMNKYPSVTVIDNNSVQVLAEVKYIDNNNVKITFTNQFSGKAFLN